MRTQKQTAATKKFSNRTFNASQQTPKTVYRKAHKARDLTALNHAEEKRYDDEMKEVWE